MTSSPRILLFSSKKPLTLSIGILFKMASRLRKSILTVIEIITGGILPVPDIVFSMIKDIARNAK